MLIDLSPPVAAPADIAEIAAQLRLPAAHAEEPEARSRLGRLFEIALRVIEARTERALVRRRFRVSTQAWAAGGRLLLPVAPVLRIESLDIVAADGGVRSVELASLRLDALAERPTIAAQAPNRLPSIPRDGHAVAVIEAGYGPDLGDAPAELRHACILLSAALYDQPWSEAAEVLPRNVLTLIEPYRRMRL